MLPTTEGRDTYKILRDGGSVEEGKSGVNPSPPVPLVSSLPFPLSVYRPSDRRLGWEGRDRKRI